MPDRAESSRVDSILQRAQQIEAPRESVDPQVLAGLREGTIKIGALPEPLAEACRDALGTSGLVDLLMEEGAADEETNPLVLRPKSSGRPMRMWMSLAAALAVVAGMGLVVLRFRGGGAMKPMVAAVLTQPFMSEKTAAAKINLPQERLATGLPNFDDQSHETLGAATDPRRQNWRLATVIIRTEQGFASGAFIDPAGWLLTNYHVVAAPVQQAALSGRLGQVQVITGHLVGRQIKPNDPVTATVYRADPVHDLALLKLDALPAGMTVVPSFALAKSIDTNADCTVIGSQFNGPAWWVRGGNISQLFNYPEDLSQFAAGIGGEQIAFDRERINVIVSDTRISPGDSGGPLLNENGELIGLTYATSLNESAGSVGWHIALPVIQQFVSPLPKTPEAVPPDLWNGGYAEPDLLTPRLLDGNTLQYRFGGSNHETIAQVRYIRLHETASLAGNDTTRELPRGVWAAPPNGTFDFDLCLLQRDDNVLALGYAGVDGELTEIRLGHSGNELAEVIWTRDPQGAWHAERPSVRLPLFDENRFSDAQKHQLALSLHARGSNDDSAVNAVDNRQTSQRVK